MLRGIGIGLFGFGLLVGVVCTVGGVVCGLPLMTLSGISCTWSTLWVGEDLF